MGDRVSGQEFQSTPPRGRRPTTPGAPSWTRTFQSTPPRGRRRGRDPAQDRAHGVSIHASAREATRGEAVRSSVVLLFQSTPPRGRRLALDVLVAAPASVSIHASAREATSPRRPRRCSSQRFNPRLRAGGDCAPATMLALGSVKFQSTPPRGRRHVCPGLERVGLVFQSTPPRGRRLGLRRERALLPLVVSIHASAREATDGERVVTIDHRAFQSTPPRGRRLGPPSTLTPNGRGFNPRLRAGGDRAARRGAVAVIAFQSTPPRGRRRAPDRRPLATRRVSIHASAREATRLDREQRRPGTSFNPRLRAGGDHTAASVDPGTCAFQSTPPRGRRRPAGEASDVQPLRFQSTPPRGRRPGTERQRPSQPLEVSIHASAREATRAGDRRTLAHRRFNPRLRAGGDPRLDASSDRTSRVSIHASAREATGVAPTCAAPDAFQSTPPRGRRPAATRPPSAARGFQSTPPRGRRPVARAGRTTAGEFQSTPPRGRRPRLARLDA